MAVKKLNAQVFTDYTFTLGADDFARHVNSVVVSSKTGSPVTFKGGKPDAVAQDIPTIPQTITIVYAQDWSAEGLALYLQQNEGKKVAATFKPLTAGPTFSADVILVAGGAGGAIDTMPTLTSVLPVVGAVGFAAGAA